MSRGNVVFLELLRDESGQDLVEYALVAGLVGLGAVISLGALNEKVRTAFFEVGNQLSNAV